MIVSCSFPSLSYQHPHPHLLTRHPILCPPTAEQTVSRPLSPLHLFPIFLLLAALEQAKKSLPRNGGNTALSETTTALREIKIRIEIGARTKTKIRIGNGGTGIIDPSRRMMPVLTSRAVSMALGLVSVLLVKQKVQKVDGRRRGNIARIAIKTAIERETRTKIKTERGDIIARIANGIGIRTRTVMGMSSCLSPLRSIHRRLVLKARSMIPLLLRLRLQFRSPENRLNRQ